MLSRTCSGKAQAQGSVDRGPRRQHDGFVGLARDVVRAGWWSERFRSTGKLISDITCDANFWVKLDYLRAQVHDLVAVSYTHLTLPTIYSV